MRPRLALLPLVALLLACETPPAKSPQETQEETARANRRRREAKDREETERDQKVLDDVLAETKKRYEEDAERSNRRLAEDAKKEADSKENIEKMNAERRKRIPSSAFPSAVAGFPFGANREAVSKICKESGGSDKLSAILAANTKPIPQYWCSRVPVSTGMPVEEITVMFCKSGAVCTVLNTIFLSEPGENMFEKQGKFITTAKMLLDKYGVPNADEGKMVVPELLGSCAKGKPQSATWAWFWNAIDASVALTYNCRAGENGGLIEGVMVIYNNAEGSKESHERSEFKQKNY